MWLDLWRQYLKKYNTQISSVYLQNNIFFKIFTMVKICQDRKIYLKIKQICIQCSIYNFQLHSFGRSNCSVSYFDEKPTLTILHKKRELGTRISSV